MRTPTFTILICLAAASVATDAAEPAPPRDDRSVWTVSLAVGPGWGRTADNVLRYYDDYALVPDLHDREGGPAVQLGLGYRLTPGLTVGLDLTTWSRDADDDLAAAHFDMTLAAVGARWYPWRGGLHARLGYGLGLARLDYLERGVSETRFDTGAGYALGVGYTWRVNGSVSLTPEIVTHGFATRDLDVWASLTTATLAATFDLGE